MRTCGTIHGRHPRGESRRSGRRAVRDAACVDGPRDAECLLATDDAARPAPLWDATATFVGGAAPLAVGGAPTLPLIGRDIPPAVLVRNSERGAAALAEALLVEGVLKESDWDGRSITSSLGAGITRWVSTLVPEGLERVELGIGWGDDLQAVSGMVPDLWRKTHGEGEADWEPAWGTMLGTMQEPVGFLSLQTEHDGGPHWPGTGDCIVGPAVMELEAVRRGLGFQVFGLLTEVLSPLIGVATPGYVWSELQKLGGLDVEMRGDTMHVRDASPAMQALLAEVPLEACRGDLKPAFLRDAKSMKLNPRHRQIVDLAVDVLGRYHALRSDAKVCHTPLLGHRENMRLYFRPGMVPKLATFCLRWSERDGVTEMLERYLRELKGRGCNLAYAQGWIASRPETVRRAARNWRAVTACVLRACRLAELLHSMSEETR